MSQLDLKIGPKIKAFRRQLGLQANKLAEELSISPSYLNLIEGGKRKIDGDLLLKICEKLNIELSQLTSKTDLNLENTLSEILDDELFEDLDILGPEVKDLVGTNPKIGKAIVRLGDILKKKDFTVGNLCSYIYFKNFQRDWSQKKFYEYGKFLDSQTAANEVEQSQKNIKSKNLVCVAPDVGGVERARAIAKRLSADLAIIDKRRFGPGTSEVMNVIGDVRNKICVIIDDLVDSGGTIVNAAAALKSKGAKDVYAYVVHGVLTGEAVKKINTSKIKKFIIFPNQTLEKYQKLAEPCWTKFHKSSCSRYHLY